MFPVAVIGVTAAVGQLVLFREFLSSVAENELSLSLLLFLWLVLGGTGALLGNRWKHKPSLLPFLHLAAALLLPLAVFLLRTTRNLAFTRGAEPEVIPFFIFSLFILAPFCLLNGFFLPVANEWIKTTRKSGTAYAADCAGSLCGGLLFSLLLFRITDPFITFLFIGLLNGAAIFFLGRRVLGIAVTLIAALPLFAGMGKTTEQGLFQGLTYERSFVSRYSSLRLFRQPDSSTLLLSNSRTAFSPDNTVEAEELAHLPLLQLPEGRRVLVVSGGAAGILEEVLKHRPAQVDYVDNDPDMMATERKLGILNEAPSIRFIASDARAYLDKTRETYDCILLALPGAFTLSMNRLYTVEFYRRIKAHLSRDGVVALALPGMPDYLSAEFTAILSVVKMTLAGVFRETVFFPGNSTVTLASDRPISTNVDSLLASRPLHNRFLNTNYLAGFFTPFRFDQINHLAENAEPNRDFKPSLFLKFQNRFLSEYSFNALFLLVPAVLLALFFLFVSGRGTYPLFSTALAATGGEIFLLTAFEIHFGTLYYAMSFLFALFLLGLAVGFGAGLKGLFRRGRSADLAIMAAIPLLLCVTLPGCRMLIIPFLLLLSFLSGAQFAALSKEFPERFSSLYAADLVGGALGAILMGALLFPLFGPLIAVGVLFTLKAVSLLSRYKGNPSSIN